MKKRGELIVGLLASAGAVVFVTAAIAVVKRCVPVLSLGSGPDADGIYQVSADVVGFSVFQRPKSAQRFVDARALAEQGMRAYVEGVRAGNYPPKVPSGGS